jgi:hypothetical protein
MFGRPRLLLKDQNIDPAPAQAERQAQPHRPGSDHDDATLLDHALLRAVPPPKPSEAAELPP